MDVKNIITFLRVAELRSFTKAAEEMNYVQSTVTTQIQQLEKELGYPLFERTNRSVALTTFGEAYLPLARKMYQTTQEMYSLNTEAKEMTGTLRVGIVESLFFSDFLRLISLFQAQFPKVVLDFYTGSSVEIVDLIRQNKLDFGCCLAANPSGELLRMFSCPAPVVFVANKNHPLVQEKSVSLGAISHENFVLTEEISVYHQILLQMFARHDLEIKVNIRLKSTRGIVEILKYSDGISFLPEYAVRSEVEKGQLGIIRADIPRQEVSVVVTTRRDKWISPPMEVFLRLLREEKWLADWDQAY